MYVTYVKSQYCLAHSSLSERLGGPYSQPPRKIPQLLVKPKDFMPSRLVRISDVKVIAGSEVHEGYCALSYSWQWCGDNIVDEASGKGKRNDEGKHRIIFPARRTKQKRRGRKRIHGKIKFVKFEGIIQQICKDFNVKYIWYDQLCIDQDNMEEKQREIRQMHRIYSNAYCTAVLLPELQTKQSLYYSEGQCYPQYLLRNLDDDTLYGADWFTRLWTLEEVLMSKKVLFVGRDVHVWWYTLRCFSEISALFKKSISKNLCTILFHAHMRTSTNNHDRIFALANIVPEIIDKINISYDQPLEELMLQFYGLLAKKDLSILCFGNYSNYGGIFGSGNRRPFLTVRRRNKLLKAGKKNDGQINSYKAPICKLDFLPSWTGIDGEHILWMKTCLLADKPPTTTFQDFSISGRTMKVTCPCVLPISAPIKKANLTALWYKNLRPILDKHRENGSASYICLALSVPPLPYENCSKNEVILYSVLVEPSMDIQEPPSWIVEQTRSLSCFLNRNKANFIELDKQRYSGEIPSRPALKFSLIEYGCSSCIILSGIPFDYEDPSVKQYPVIKKIGEHYKAVGSCEIGNIEKLFPDYMDNEQTFIIE